MLGKKVEKRIDRHSKTVPERKSTDSSSTRHEKKPGTSLESRAKPTNINEAERNQRFYSQLDLPAGSTRRTASNNSDDDADQKFDFQRILPTKYTTSMTPNELDRYNQKISARQINIESLPAAEQEEQETWAQSRLSLGPCPTGCGWRRYQALRRFSGFSGYRCTGGDKSHLVTHKSLVNGKGEFFMMWFGTTFYEGPYDSRNPRYPGSGDGERIYYA